MAILKIGALNCRGQTKLNLAKQLQIQFLLKMNNLDILLCQETYINDTSFKNCEYIMKFYNIISNNALNEYGTLCIVKNSLDISDIKFDTEGRVITFNIDSITVCNVYPKAGTDAESRKQREILFAQTIPNMLRFRKQKIIIGGDWNKNTDGHIFRDSLSIKVK